ncbi:MAG: 50S ribosomal protein L19 [Phycisphaerae bacterium]|nr:50S ribosomal protein L19 [Phycisphaerae bacterium]
MTSRIIEKVEQAYIKKDRPEFSVGDTVSVSVRIVEGQKERTQVFSGTVISRKGKGLNEMFTVRRIVNNEGVERIFPLNSPQVLAVKVLRSGHVRRAKLYYLRDRIGKSVRLRDKQRGLAPKKTAKAD